MPEHFQSTRPVGGATTIDGVYPVLFCFNPRAPWGARPGRAGSTAASCLFQSTRPVGGATPDGTNVKRIQLFQSTRPVGGATDDILLSLAVLKVSIHAPRGGRDSQDA